MVEQMNETVKQLDADWQANLVVLATTLSDLRVGDSVIEELTDHVQRIQQRIDELEGAAVLDQTEKGNPNKAINGANESERRKQTASLLATLRAQPEHQIHDLCVSRDELTANLTTRQMVRRVNLDTVTLQKLKLEHIDSILKALQ